MKKAILILLMTISISGCTSCWQAVEMIFPASQRPVAHRISRKESTDNAFARNRSGASGCFQLMPVHAWRFPGGWAMRFDAVSNTTAALHLWAEQGWGPWR
jgi:hypothetical protein